MTSSHMKISDGTDLKSHANLRLSRFALGRKSEDAICISEFSNDLKSYENFRWYRPQVTCKSPIEQICVGSQIGRWRGTVEVGRIQRYGLAVLANKCDTWGWHDLLLLDVTKGYQFSLNPCGDCDDIVCADV